MNSIFGDATTVAATPETLAEAESLFSGNRSPVPSFRLGDDDAGEQIPDIDLQPPKVEIRDGKAILPESQGEGVAGWISNLANAVKGSGDDGNGSGSGSKYRRVGQDDDQ